MSRILRKQGNNEENSFVRLGQVLRKVKRVNLDEIVGRNNFPKLQSSVNNFVPLVANITLRNVFDELINAIVTRKQDILLRVVLEVLFPVPTGFRGEYFP